MNVCGYNMTRACAEKTFAQAGFAPGQGRDQVGVVELHDCFSANEVRAAACDLFVRRADTDWAQLITYEALGLCAPGEAHKMVDRGDNTVRRRYQPGLRRSVHRRYLSTGASTSSTPAAV